MTRRLTDCDHCDGHGWVTGRGEHNTVFPSKVYETVKPCGHCDRVDHEQWPRWIKDAREHRRRDEDVLYEVHPDEAIAIIHDLKGFVAETVAEAAQRDRQTGATPEPEPGDPT